MNPQLLANGINLLIGGGFLSEDTLIAQIRHLLVQFSGLDPILKEFSYADDYFNREDVRTSLLKQSNLNKKERLVIFQQGEKLLSTAL